MTLVVRSMCSALLAALLLTGANDAGAAIRSDSLSGSGDGHERLTDVLLWKRRVSIRDLEKAAMRSPRDPATLHRLGQVYLDAGFHHLARDAFYRALRVDSEDPVALFQLGLICERDWLATPVSTTADSALDLFSRAARARSDFAEAWTALAVLRFERGDPRGARDAAVMALVATPDAVEPQLANAYLAFRNGLVALADSLFRVAIPRLPAAITARFDDIAPLLVLDEATALAARNPQERAEFVRHFWALSDPDPTTPENEARLEFDSRLAHALLLLRDPWSPRWLPRTELYSRYGKRVQIENSFDSHHDEMPRVEWGDVPETPTPEALASLGQMVTQQGMALFDWLPRGGRKRQFDLVVRRFEDQTWTRLEAYVQTLGSPMDSIAAECVVLDTLRQVIERASSALSASACDPAELRAGAFTFRLPPGHYELAFAVHDTRGGRGLARTLVETAAVASGLSMSDVNLQCGRPDLSAGVSTVRLSPDFSTRIEGREPLIAYFEIYHLRCDANGTNRFEYEYSIRNLESDKPTSRRLRHLLAEASSRLKYHSTQEGVGPLRRQFIRVPVESLPTGRYQLTLRVHDARAGVSVQRSVDFEKVEPPAR